MASIGTILIPSFVSNGRYLFETLKQEHTHAILRGDVTDLLVFGISFFLDVALFRWLTSSRFINLEPLKMKAIFSTQDLEPSNKHRSTTSQVT
jgi:uncharacterized membrane protein